MGKYYPDKPVKRAGGRDIGSDIAALMGWKVKDCWIFLRMFREAIRARLKRGQPVHIENLGTWTFKFRKGRTTNWGPRALWGRNPVSVQKDRWCLTFKPSKGFAAEVNRDCDPVTAKRDLRKIRTPKWKDGYPGPTSPPRESAVPSNSPGQSQGAQAPSNCTHNPNLPPEMADLLQSLVASGSGSGEGTCQTRDSGSTPSNVVSVEFDSVGSVLVVPPKPCE